MSMDRLISSYFLAGGVLLLLISLLLHFILPIHPAFPPFVLTPVLAILYGLFWYFRSRERKPAVSSAEQEKR